MNLLTIPIVRALDSGTLSDLARAVGQPTAPVTRQGQTLTLHSREGRRFLIHRAGRVWLVLVPLKRRNHFDAICSLDKDVHALARLIYTVFNDHSTGGRGSEKNQGR